MNPYWDDPAQLTCIGPLAGCTVLAVFRDEDASPQDPYLLVLRNSHGKCLSVWVSFDGWLPGPNGKAVVNGSGKLPTRKRARPLSRKLPRHLDLAE